MKVMQFIIILIVLSPISAIAQQEDIIEKARVSEKYSILSIKETKRYYILGATKKYVKDILLVVEKGSEQLKGNKPKIGKKYKFNTYSISDVIQGHICHYVDNKKVWCHNDGIDLRFTDSMGDDVEIEE